MVRLTDKVTVAY